MEYEESFSGCTWETQGQIRRLLVKEAFEHWESGADSSEEKSSLSFHPALTDCTSLSQLTMALPRGHLWGGGRDFPRSLLKAPPGRSDYLTICQKGGLQNLWHFWIATVFCHRKEKANHFFQQTTPSVSCTDYYEIAKDHTLGFLCFHSF